MRSTAVAASWCVISVACVGQLSGKAQAHQKANRPPSPPPTKPGYKAESGGPPPTQSARWGVGAVGDSAGKKKLRNTDSAPVPTLGLVTKTAFMGGRRQFYGRGSAVLDVDGDGFEDVWLSNGDNHVAQGMFGVDECSSRLFLGFGNGTFRDVNVVSTAAPKGKPNRRQRRKEKRRWGAGSTPLGVPPDATTTQWGQVFFVGISSSPTRSRPLPPCWPVSPHQRCAQDMDNDGDPDLVILNGGYEGPSQLFLFENVGAEKAGDAYFRDVTESAGLAGDNFRQFWWGGSAADCEPQAGPPPLSRACPFRG